MDILVYGCLLLLYFWEWWFILKERSGFKKLSCYQLFFTMVTGKLNEQDSLEAGIQPEKDQPLQASRIEIQEVNIMIISNKY